MRANTIKKKPVQKEKGSLNVVSTSSQPTHTEENYFPILLKEPLKLFNL